MAKDKDKKDKGKKDKEKDGAPADGKKGAPKGEVVDPGGPSVAAHPRAVRAVARAKAWAGLLGFSAGAYFSLPTGTLAQALERALVAGVVSYVAVWAAAVFLWRRLVMLELKGREQQLVNAANARQPPAAQSRPAARSAS